MAHDSCQRSKGFSEPESQKRRLTADTLDCQISVQGTSPSARFNLSMPPQHLFQTLQSPPNPPDYPPLNPDTPSTPHTRTPSTTSPCSRKTLGPGTTATEPCYVKRHKTVSSNSDDNSPGSIYPADHYSAPQRRLPAVAALGRGSRRAE